MQPTQPTAAVVCQRVQIIGMTCSHCKHAVSHEIGQLPGVVTVTVDAATGTATVTATRVLDRDEIAAAVNEAGYEFAS